MWAIKRKLLNLQSTTRNDLERYVIDYILDRYSNEEEIKTFFYDITNFGCVSWMINGLIYYNDTHDFYDKYYYEIEELREDTEFNIGEPIKINGDLKNFLAWFWFEQTCRKLGNEFDIV